MNDEVALVALEPDAASPCPMPAATDPDVALEPVAVNATEPADAGAKAAVPAEAEAPASVAGWSEKIVAAPAELDAPAAVAKWSGAMVAVPAELDVPVAVAKWSGAMIAVPAELDVPAAVNATAPAVDGANAAVPVDALSPAAVATFSTRAAADAEVEEDPARTAPTEPPPPEEAGSLNSSRRLTYSLLLLQDLELGDQLFGFGNLGVGASDRIRVPDSLGFGAKRRLASDPRPSLPENIVVVHQITIALSITVDVLRIM